MIEFQQELHARARRAMESLERAVDSGDDYAADIHRSEIQTVLRLADEHDLRLPELDAFRDSAAA